MKRDKRRGGPVLLAGLGGFALGAATVLFVVWVYGLQPPRGGAGAAPGPAAVPGPLPGQAVAPPVPGSPGTARQPGPVGTPGTSGEPGGAAPPGIAETPGGPGSPGTPDVPTGPGPGTPPGTTSSPPPASSADVEALGARRLLLPVQGVRREQLRDSFAEGRAGHQHEAMDILAARNTPVLAVEDGRLAKLFFSRQGGNTIYQFDPAETYAYYYAHLERYAAGLHEGDLLRRGQVIGYVGTSGNAPPDTPHLHFAIFRLTPEKQWWKGTAIDPYPVLTRP